MPRDRSVTETLQDIYKRLFETYGPQHWWPGDTPFEVMVGAILTQSAAWSNVEKAISNLKKAGVLSPAAIRRLGQAELAALIYSSGYYNAKALKLRALADWLRESCGDNISKLSAADTAELRKSLLSVHGIGEETADSILLYAVGKPVFVIDAYTRRIIDRLGPAPEGRRYDDYQRLFMDNLSFSSAQDKPADAPLFNEYHALLVRLGKEVCRRKPLCGQCCLRDLCGYALRV